MSPFQQAGSFVAARTRAWDELENLLRKEKTTRGLPSEISRAHELYREVCTDLSRAKRLGCEPRVLTYLDGLVSRAHSQVYSQGGAPFLHFTQLFWWAFPTALRKNGWLFLLGNVLFWIPFLISMIRSLDSEAFSAEVLPIEVLQQMADVYRGDLAAGREVGDNAKMAGFYVYNNVSIAFRCFATGIFFGLGSVFYLVYNGAVTGATLGYVARAGGGENIVTFMCGHAPLELLAIVISGAAGLQMGHALLATRGRTRLASLILCRHQILYQVFGALLFLLLAAGIEGFWSPSPAPRQLKWAVSAILFVAVALYLGLSGRGVRAAEELDP